MLLNENFPLCMLRSAPDITPAPPPPRHQGSPRSAPEIYHYYLGHCIVLDLMNSYQIQPEASIVVSINFLGAVIVT